MTLPNWLKKSLVITLSILTLGMVTPSDFLSQSEAAQNKSNKKSEASDIPIAVNTLAYESSYETDRQFKTDYFLEKAEEVSKLKFGERIAPVIEEEFSQVILPRIEEAIHMYLQDAPDEVVASLAVSGQPASGTGEKIFHIYNRESGEDVIRFHVRRENPPKQGHWFTFHYHTDKDGFMSHHEIGKIYWDKNTPPQWGSAKSVLH